MGSMSLKVYGNMIIKSKGMSEKELFCYLEKNGTTLSSMGSNIPDGKTVEITPDELIKYKLVSVDGYVTMGV